MHVTRCTVNGQVVNLAHAINLFRRRLRAGASWSRLLSTALWTVATRRPVSHARASEVRAPDHRASRSQGPQGTGLLALDRGHQFHHGIRSLHRVGFAHADCSHAAGASVRVRALHGSDSQGADVGSSVPQSGMRESGASATDGDAREHPLRLGTLRGQRSQDPLQARARVHAREHLSPTGQAEPNVPRLRPCASATELAAKA